VGGGHGVESGGLQINFIQPTNNKVPCGSPRLGHVAPYNQPKSATCCNIIHPYLSTNECHVSYGPANPSLPHVVRTCHVSIRTNYTECTVNIPFFCLFVILNRTRYLSLPTSVRTQTSCVGFVMMRPTLLFDLKRFQAL
jgi:hypothetical protein